MDETNSPSKAQYNMIIETDLLEELILTLCNKSGTITWYDVIVSMKECGTILDVEITQDIDELTKELSVLKMSEDAIGRTNRNNIDCQINNNWFLCFQK